MPFLVYLFPSGELSSLLAAPLTGIIIMASAYLSVPEW